MKTTFLFIPVFFLALSVYGQTLPANPLDQRYTPPQGSIFDVKSNTGKTSSALLSRDLKNYIGVNLPLLGRGIAAFSYSRVLHPTLSVYGSLGVSYSADKIMFKSLGIPLEYTESNDPDSMANDNRWFSFLLSKSTPVNHSSLFYEVGFRYFLDENFYDGMFFGMSYRNYNNKLSATLAEEPFKLNLKPEALQFVTGSTFTNEKGSLVHELYTGISIRRLRLDKPKARYDQNQYGYTYISSFETTRDKAQIITLGFLLGYTLHFGF